MSWKNFISEIIPRRKTFGDLAYSLMNMKTWPVKQTLKAKCWSWVVVAGRFTFFVACSVELFCWLQCLLFCCLFITDVVTTAVKQLIYVLIALLFLWIMHF